MRVKQVSEEVLYADEPIVKVGRQEIELLKEKAGTNQRQRVRLCAHKDVSDKLHEMLIVLKKNAYIRPHRHLDKVESFHIIEGAVDVVIFDEAGKITEVVQMGDYSSERKLYYRLSVPNFHTLLIRSDFLVFHETTNGPFDRAQSIYADWSPEEHDGTAGSEFMSHLADDVDNFLASRLSAA